MLHITVRVVNLDATADKLKILRSKFNDFSAALTTLSGMLIKFYGDTNFISSGSALGESWDPLKSNTIREKTRQWPGRGILERSGDLKEGFEGDVSPMMLQITNPVDYFLFHQLGTASGPGRGHNIPARKMLGVNDTVEDMAREVIEADVREKIDTTMEA